MTPHLEPWTTWMRASGLSAGTIRVRCHYVRQLAARYPARDVLTLSTDEITDYLARPGWRPETRKSARMCIQRFYRWAQLTGRVDHDPARLLPTVTVPLTVPRPTPDAVLARALLLGGRRDRLMVMLAAYAGLRREEIARTHSRDVLGETLLVRGKGGRERTVPLHPHLLVALAGIPDGYLFPGSVDGHLSAGHVGRILARLLGPGWTAHTLRHRFATRAYAAERDLLAVQELLGHSRPETTRRYTALPDGALRAAVLAAGDDRPRRDLRPPAA